LAEHYKNIKHTQLNSDVFTGIIASDWQQMVEEYKEAKKVQGVAVLTRQFDIENNQIRFLYGVQVLRL
jgi:hypothetical protein